MRIRQHISENLGRSRRFSHAREFSQTLSRFSPGYEGMENMFYFIMKLLFSVLTKRRTIYEAHMNTLISFIKL